jgi:LPS export ABC transporter permease LptG
MRISGLSYKKISKVLALTALVVIAFTIFVGEVVKPRASSALTAFSLSNEAGELVVQTFQSGSWFKDQNKIINARHISDNYDIHGMVVYQIDPDNRAFEMIISSEQARLFEDGVWALDDVSVVAFDNDRVIKSELEKLDIKTSITHGVVNLISTDQESISFLDLSKYINHLETNGEDAYSYRSTQWERVGHLAIIFTLILIGPLFVSSNSRGRQPSFWVFNGVLVGVSLYFFTQLLMAIATLGRIAPPIYTLMPPVLILFIAALYVKFKGE